MTRLGTTGRLNFTALENEMAVTTSTFFKAFDRFSEDKSLTCLEINTLRGIYADIERSDDKEAVMNLLENGPEYAQFPDIFDHIVGKESTCVLQKISTPLSARQPLGADTFSSKPAQGMNQSGQPFVHGLGISKEQLTALPIETQKALARWVSMGLEFEGATPEHLGHFVSALAAVETKLGEQTSSILGLSPERPLTFRVDMNMSAARNTSYDLIEFGPPLAFNLPEYFRDYVTHELGHHVAAVAGIWVPSGSKPNATGFIGALSFQGPLGKEWLEAGGWSPDGFVSSKADGAVSDYGRTNASDDFADAFCAFITQGRGVMPNRKLIPPSLERSRVLAKVLNLPLEKVLWTPD